MPSHPRRAVGCVALAVFAVLGVAVLTRTGQALYARMNPPVAEQAPPTAVAALRVAPQPFDFTVPVTGSLAPVHSADVFPKQGGRVVRLHVGLGERVQAGQALVTVESPEYTLMKRQADEGLAAAEQGAQVAERALGRLDAVREKLGDEALSEQDYDMARVQAEGARAQAEVASLQRDLARQMIRNATMTAPFDGVVTKINARLGGMVGKEFPSLHVDDLSSLILRCQVGEADLPRVQLGQIATLHADSMPGRVITGQVTAIAPSLDAWTRRAPVEISVADDDLPGNLFVRGELLIQRDPAALVVPIEAVHQGTDQAQVQLIREGVVAEVPVQVRGSHGGQVAVSGLQEGDVVVLPGPLHLSQGEPVTPLYEDTDVAQ